MVIPIGTLLRLTLSNNFNRLHRESGGVPLPRLFTGTKCNQVPSKCFKPALSEPSGLREEPCNHKKKAFSLNFRYLWRPLRFSLALHPFFSPWPPSACRAQASPGLWTRRGTETYGAANAAGGAGPARRLPLNLKRIAYFRINSWYWALPSSSRILPRSPRATSSWRRSFAIIALTFLPKASHCAVVW